MRVLVTGASGFVGAALVRRFATEPDMDTRGASRRALELPIAGIETVRVGELGPHADWREALAQVDAVVHTAARVHVMRDSSTDPLAAFRKANVEGTLALARQAASCGVKRFVFVSSIKVNGEGTRRGRPYRADDVPAPGDPYGVSKHEAEVQLRELARLTGLEVTIVRPVLVYGPGVKGNFHTMVQWIRRGVPLPLGLLDNRRSLVALDNLIDLLVVCVRHPAAVNQTLLVSDDDDVSTPELLRRVGTAMQRPTRLVPVPPLVLRVLGLLTGRVAEVQRLCGDLQVDITPTCALLGWRPTVSMPDALRRLAEAY